MPQDIDAALRDLAPQGTMRAAINFGNAVLAQRHSGEARGVSVDIARELGRRLGVPVELVTFDAAGKVVDATNEGVWDVAFLASDPKRAAEILFSPPCLLIEGAYLVRDGSAISVPEQVDQAGVRVGAGKGAAYELFLSRTLKHAQVERFSTALEAFQLLAEGRLDVAAGVRQVVGRFASDNGSMRVLSPSFMVIEQAVGTPAGRDAGARYLETFIEDLKRCGFVAEALDRSGQSDASVAPARFAHCNAEA